jgi:type II secretion system protein I
MSTPGKKHLLRRRHGLSLLEVMLALAILGGAIAVIGELMRFGMRNAESARDLSTAQVFCEAKINEITAGLLLPQSVGSTPIEEMASLGADATWLYSVEVQEVDQQGLISVRVTVTQDSSVKMRPVSFSLVCWMIDPMQVPVETTNDTGSSTGGTGG